MVGGLPKLQPGGCSRKPMKNKQIHRCGRCSPPGELPKRGVLAAYFLPESAARTPRLPPGCPGEGVSWFTRKARCLRTCLLVGRTFERRFVLQRLLTERNRLELYSH